MLESILHSEILDTPIEKDPYTLLGVGFMQFDRSNYFLVVVYLALALIMIVPTAMNVNSSPSLTGQGYEVPFRDRITVTNWPVVTTQCM